MEIGSSYPETKIPPAVYKSQEVFLISCPVFGVQFITKSGTFLLYRDEVLSKDFVPCFSQDGSKNDR